MSETSPRELESALDTLVQRFGADEEETLRARAAYADRTGRVFEDDELFEARTTSFLEWYVLEWPWKDDAPGVVIALRDGGPDVGDEVRAAWRAWATSHRSLFMVRELRDHEFDLVDLVGGGRFTVDERRRLHGVGPGDVLEARLIGWRDRVRFGRTFCFHPAVARRAIEHHVRRMRDKGQSRADVVDFVASLRVKVERYKHVPAERVYETEGR